MKYIRVNYVDAEPMKFGEFKAKFPTSGGANQQRPDDDEGYVITYRKGEPNEYVSWCPKAEFEAVSHPINPDGVSYGMAIDACRYCGKKIQRKNWNGEGQVVRYEETLVSEDGKLHLSEENAPGASVSSCFVFHFVNRKTGETGVQVGWLASQADMAASDWIILD